MILRLSIDGFALRPELTRALEGVRDDPQFSRATIQIGTGGLLGAIEHYRDNATPQVLIVEEIGDMAQMEERLARLAEVCEAKTQVIVVGGVNDIACYRKLLAAGIGDYLVGPVTAVQIAAAIKALFADPATAPAGRLIAFVSARGGAGGSTLAHNVAWILSRPANESVIAVDLDLAFGTLGLAFNADAPQTVGELLGEPERIDAQLVERLLVRVDERLQLLPSAGVDGTWPAVEIEAVDKLLELLRRMASVVVVDLPHQWTPWVAHALAIVDEVVVVSPPDLAGLRDSKALLDGLEPLRNGRQRARLAINKLDLFRKSQISVKDFEGALKQRPAVNVPFDPVFGEALNEGQMVGKISRNSKLLEPLTALAHLVDPRHPERTAGGRWRKLSVPGWIKRMRPAPRH